MWLIVSIELYVLLVLLSLSRKLKKDEKTADNEFFTAGANAFPVNINESVPLREIPTSSVNARVQPQERIPDEGMHHPRYSSVNRELARMHYENLNLV